MCSPRSGRGRTGRRVLRRRFRPIAPRWRNGPPKPPHTAMISRNKTWLDALLWWGSAANPDLCKTQHIRNKRFVPNKREVLREVPNRPKSSVEIRKKNFSEGHLHDAFRYPSDPTPTLHLSPEMTVSK